mmetsp:Transcript_16157/g.51568  ORF Transcript_16157/g.51568 Transcript_16157/m.51568 type:complete len:298 (+) Transcript_16157:1090-1983(+)
MNMCWPTGRPRSVVGVARPKRKRRVLALISSRSIRGMSIQTFGSSATGPLIGVMVTVRAGAAVVVGVSPKAPISYFSSIVHALLECSASKSSVQSVPAVMRMEDAPPGWSSRNGVESYTLPLTTNQQSSLVECLATSSIVYVLPPALTLAATGSGAAAGAAPGLPIDCSSNQPPKLPGPASVGCWNLREGLPAASRTRWMWMRKWELFIMPITFHTMLSGCRFIAASHARQRSSAFSEPGEPIVKRSETSTSCSQKTQHQWRPYSVGFSVRLMVVSVHVWPPSSDSSTRMILRPPPV